MVVKTYRGLLKDGAQEKIPLSTKDGSVGYRIVKLQAMSENPYAGDAAEHIVKLWKTSQTTVDGNVNFTDNDLIGVVIINNHTSGYSTPSIPTIIFDTEIFNQDIFVTHFDAQSALQCNYYIELEQMKLDQTQNMSATLKAIRGSAVD